MLLKENVKYTLMWIAHSIHMRQNHHLQERRTVKKVLYYWLLLSVLAAVDKANIALSMNETHTGSIQGEDNQDPGSK